MDVGDKEIERERDREREHGRERKRVDVGGKKIERT